MTPILDGGYTGAKPNKAFLQLFFQYCAYENTEAGSYYMLNGSTALRVMNCFNSQKQKYLKYQLWLSKVSANEYSTQHSRLGKISSKCKGNQSFINMLRSCLQWTFGVVFKYMPYWTSQFNPIQCSAFASPAPLLCSSSISCHVNTAEIQTKFLQAMFQP